MKDLLVKHIEHKFCDLTTQRSDVVSYHLLYIVSWLFSHYFICFHTKFPSGNPKVLSPSTIICYSHYVKLVLTTSRMKNKHLLALNI